jgi:hypothetical protein
MGMFDDIIMIGLGAAIAYVFFKWKSGRPV